MITDPPYGIRYKSSGKGNLVRRDLLGDKTTEAATLAMAIWGIRPAAVCWMPKSRIPSDAKFRGHLAWDKGNLGMGDLSFPWKPNWEMVYIYGKGWSGKRTSSVVRHKPIPWADADKIHPTQKPLSLMRELIEKAPPGLIVDPFAGSCSTLIAANQCGREAIGAELDPKMFRAARRRMKRHGIT